MKDRIIADSDEECEPLSPVLSPIKAPSQTDAYATTHLTATNTVTTETLLRDIDFVQQNLDATRERATKRRKSSISSEYTSSQAAPKRRKTAQTYGQSTIGLGGSSSESVHIQLATLQRSEQCGKASDQTGLPNDHVLRADGGSWNLPATIQNEFNHLVPDTMFSEASSTVPDNTLTRHRLFGDTLLIESPSVLGEPALGPIVAENNTSSLEWSSILTTLTGKSHSVAGNDGPASQHLVIPDEQIPQNSTETPTEGTHTPQGSPQKVAKLLRESLIATRTATPIINARISSGAMRPPITPPKATRTISIKLSAEPTSHSDMLAGEPAPGAQSVSKGTRKPRRSGSMVSPIQAESRRGKRVKTAVKDSERETETLIVSAEIVTAVLPEQKKSRRGRSVSLQDTRVRSAGEPCDWLPKLSGKGDKKCSVDTDHTSKDGIIEQLKEQSQPRPSRSRSMQILASSSAKKHSASKQKLGRRQTMHGIADSDMEDLTSFESQRMAKAKRAETTDLKEVDSLSPESSKVDPLTILHSNNVCVEIPVIDPMEEVETSKEEKQGKVIVKKLRRQNSTNPPLVQDQSSTNYNEGEASIDIHEDEDAPIELPKKQGRGRPKKSTFAPAVPSRLEVDTSLESEVKAQAKMSEGISYQVLQEIDANSLASLPDTNEESLLDGTRNEAPPPKKITPSPLTPQKVENSTRSTGIPSVSKSKAKYRIGLSRTARCPPLLKMVKK